MKVEDLGTFLIYLGTVAGALLAIGALCRYAIVRPLIRWMRAQLAAPVRQVAAQVTPHEDDADTLRDLVLAQGWRLATLEQRFADHVRDHV
jgi:hypothetical protein